MQTRSLKTLVHVAKTGSFARAAEELNMTLSALSMQMKALETELAVDLFDRSVRPPRLTPMGRSVVDEAIPLLQREDSLLEICQPSGAMAGRFRIGFITTAAVRLLPTFLEAAQRRAPKATFDIETGLSQVLQTKVVNGQIDAAVVTDADGLPDALSETILQREPFVFAAHKERAKDGLETLLARHPFFHFMPDTGIGKVIAREMRALKRPTSTRTIVLDNLEAIMECVSSGLGFTLLPKPDVDRYKTDDVVTLPTPRPLRRTLVLAIHRDGALASREDILADLLTGE